MTDQSITPALTAEEWKAALPAPRLFVNGDSLVQVGGLPDFATDHQIAALALYGQPFGFTAEDVALLHEAAMLADEAMNSGPTEEGDHLRLVADKIAALLPP